MAGFDHSSHEAQVAAAIEYVAGDRALSWKGKSFPALIESIPPRLAPAFDKRKSNEVVVAVTIARSLFAAKQVSEPRVGDSLVDTAGRNYRIQSLEGAPTDAEARFTCGTVTTFPA